MGWTHETGKAAHEAWLTPVFDDGVRSLGSMMVDGVSYEMVEHRGFDDDRPMAELGRPSAQIVGWELTCDCYSLGGRVRTRWVDKARWERVPSPSLQDLARRRVYADDDEASFVGERDDVEAAALARWTSEHLEPLEVDDAIRAAVAARRAADEQLTQAVARARAAGRSWAKIGAAAGITPASAHQRWRDSTQRMSESVP